MAGGGSLLTLPVLLLAGVPAPIANGTLRISIVAQNLVALGTFRRHGFSELKEALFLSLFACAGAVGGALLGVRMSGPWFDRIVVLTMVVCTLLILRRGKTGKAPGTGRRWLGYAALVFAGAWGGFIQVGVGFLLMPALNRILGMDLVRVNMYKVVIILPYTVLALAIFAWQSEILWLAGLALALGNSTGGWLGARLTVSKGEPLIRAVFLVAVAAMAASLLLRG
ncbi:MAG: sulfite exporter TauE/SafE family protein [Gammaproteobacteria bacterium]|nr:sulfite exporter TauE/SafE family protein [Gammaproteobacteria bacterium]MYD01473.1 sulfite exporter TauE/SafE family protein [Gammaproteobacteria bacterium]MYI26159.1 sulfite exporter TauE/SafE family protein [Gammaproteobacteria bacterium]